MTEEITSAFVPSRWLSDRSPLVPWGAAVDVGRGEVSRVAYEAAREIARAAWRGFPRLGANGLHPGKGSKVIPIAADQVETAMAFLQQFRPTKTGRVSSYSIKHAAERYGARHGGAAYVSNGAAIVAALQLGLVVLEYPGADFRCPNALIGIGLGEFKRFIAKEM